MKAYMIRGQSSGVMHDRVFVTYPTEEQLTEALARELELHGLDKAGEPRERWVMVQETDLVGFAGRPAPEPGPNAVRRVSGKLDDEALARIRAVGPPTASVGAVGEVVASGAGAVLNPGDPGWVDGKAEKEARLRDQEERASRETG